MSGSAKIIGSISIGDIFGEPRKTTKPEGYNFVVDIADAAGMSYSQAANKLREALRQGKVDRVDVLMPNGKVRNAYNVAI